MSTPGYFVTGTDTGVGKTLVTAAATRYFVQQGLKTGCMKPVASGAFTDGNAWRNEDVEILRRESNISLPASIMNPYLMKEATAPHLAAVTEGVNIQLKHIQACFREIQQVSDMVLVEGAGGFIVPFNEHFSSDDLMVDLNLPVILVVGIRLGCINHALLTQRAIASRNLNLAGWVANIIDPQETRADAMIASIQQRIHAPMLGQLPWHADMNATMAANLLDFTALTKEASAK